MVTKKKKTTKKKVSKPKITKEQLQAEALKLANEKLASNGIQEIETPIETNNDNKRIEELLLQEIGDNTEYSDNIPLEWQGVFNMLTRMYETSEETYNKIKYNSVKNLIQVILDTEHFVPKNEYHRIIGALNYSTLSYDLIEKPEENKFIVEIKIK